MNIPSNVSSIMLQHLSLSHDEHTGIMRQQGSGNDAFQSAERASRSSVNRRAANNLEGSDDHGVVKLNSLPILNSSLQTEAIQPYRSKHDAEDNKVKEKDADENSKQDQEHTDKEQIQTDYKTCLAELLEIQALQTIIETSQSIQASMNYKSLFVSLIYRHHLSQVGEISAGQLMTVSPLEITNGQIHAYSTLLIPSPGGKIRERQFHSQLVHGHPVDAPSWIFVRMERLEIYSEIAWRLKPEGPYTAFTGVAIALGSNQMFQDDTAKISINIPGASQEKNWLC